MAKHALDTTVVTLAMTSCFIAMRDEVDHAAGALVV
jgi:hypothetical protein